MSTASTASTARPWPVVPFESKARRLEIIAKALRRVDGRSEWCHRTLAALGRKRAALTDERRRILNGGR